MTDIDLGTHKRGDSLEFTVELTVTIDNVDIDDLTGWDPRCQFRADPSDTEGVDAELRDIDGKNVTFGLPDTTMADMAGAYKGDVQVTNPEADPGYGVITWPGEDSYLLLAVAFDSTHPVP